MTADMRRFRYALEPVRAKSQWDLESLRRQLEAARREVDAGKARLAEQRERRVEGSRLAQRAVESRMDPRLHQALLAWLARAAKRIRALEQELAATEERHAEARARCLAQERRTEAVNSHREKCVAEFRIEDLGRMATEADRDWLTRAENVKSRSRHLPPASPEEEG